MDSRFITIRLARALDSIDYTIMVRPDYMSCSIEDNTDYTMEVCTLGYSRRRLAGMTSLVLNGYVFLAEQFREDVYTRDSYEDCYDEDDCDMTYNVTTFTMYYALKGGGGVRFLAVHLTTSNTIDYSVRVEYEEQAGRIVTASRLLTRKELIDLKYLIHSRNDPSRLLQVMIPETRYQITRNKSYNAHT